MMKRMFRWIGTLAALGTLAAGVTSVSLAADAKKATCPVSGKAFEVTDKTPSVKVNGQPVYFCCTNCPAKFAQAPEKYVKAAGKCPVLGMGVEQASAADRVVVNNDLYYFCCPGCIDTFCGDLGTSVKETTDPVTKRSFKIAAATPRSTYKQQTYLFADAASKAEFDKAPEKYAIIYGR